MEGGSDGKGEGRKEMEGKKGEGKKYSSPHLQSYCDH